MRRCALRRTGKHVLPSTRGDEQPPTVPRVRAAICKLYPPGPVRGPLAGDPPVPAQARALGGAAAGHAALITSRRGC